MSATIQRLFALITLLIGGGLAATYIDRLSHHAGYWLVPVEDSVPTPPARPRHTVVVVVDGLRLDAAERMHSTERLRAEGSCGPTSIRTPTVSRPVYAMLSTGLEQDRTGARNNDETSPLAAESIWEVARRAHLRVHGQSELPWFRQLFPNGFDDYVVVPPETNVFPRALDADLTLLHPTIVDESAHFHGGVSAEYTNAVNTVDTELGALLDSIDWAQDLVVLTADHGHRDRGGHGGPQAEVAQVLTCFAGHGVTRGVLPGLEARSIAPSLALLLGLSFPRHLYADQGHDTLDLVFALLDRKFFGSAYLADRHAAVARFRAANEHQLKIWSSDDNWSAFYARYARHQALRAAGCILAFALVALVLARRRSRRTNLQTLFLVLAALVAETAAYGLLAHGLDATSLNRRPVFLINTFTGSAIGLALVAALYLAAFRDRAALSRDLTVLTATLVAINVTHIITFGWPLGFPLPSPHLYFMPFLSSTFLVTASLYAAIFPRRTVSRP